MRSRSALSALSTATALLVALGLLVLAPAGASTPIRTADGDPVATTITAVVTSPGPHQVHFDVTVGHADGSTPDGWLVFVDPAGWLSTSVPVSQSSVQATYDVQNFGDTTYTVQYQPRSSDPYYLGSETSASTTVRPYPTRIGFGAGNSGAGVIHAQAWAQSDDQNEANYGTMVFQVDDRDPIAVHVGELVVMSGDTSTVRATGGNLANLYLTGLPLRGNHHIVATFVPEAGSGLDGATDEVDVPMTMTIDQTVVLLAPSSPRAHVVDLYVRASDGPWADIAGTLVVKDLTTGERVAKWSTKGAQQLVRRRTLRGVSAGVHRYRATFTPARSMWDTLKGASAVKKVDVKR